MRNIIGNRKIGSSQCRDRLVKCLSRVRGNSQARFLGGWEVATPSGYPTKSVVLLLVHLIVSLVKLAGPGGARGLVAESLLLKHQLLILNRGRKRAPNLTFSDRLLFGLGCMLIQPARIRRIAVIVSPSSLLKFHAALVKRKYRRLFSSSSIRKKPGPKGPPAAVIKAIVEMKQRNPRYALSSDC